MSGISDLRLRNSVAGGSVWAALLRKETMPPLQANTGAVPPITPLDKNATTMRVLLYDTQAHLENFTERSDKLFSEVEQARREIGMVNTLFQREHESLSSELLDLVNRSQLEIQKSVGSPSQAEKLDLFSKDVEFRMQALDKRIDALQALNQTLSQILQTHSQMLQAMQEQQGQIISGVVPLLPLLQAVPLHIESLKNSIVDALVKQLGEAVRDLTSSRVSDGNRSSQESLRSLKFSSSGVVAEERTSSQGALHLGLSDQAITGRDDGILMSSEHLARGAEINVQKPASADVQGPPFDTPARTARRPLADLPLSGSMQKRITPGRGTNYNWGPNSETLNSPASKALCISATRSVNPDPQTALRGEASEVEREQASRTWEDSVSSSGCAPLVPATPERTTHSFVHTSEQEKNMPSVTTSSGTKRPLMSLFNKRPFAGGLKRQRRSPFREGRRFIPLVDSDNDSTDEE